jgi:rod shape-determining protein MreD
MTRAGILAVAVGLAVAVLAQVGLVAFLPTPGAVPDLVLVGVVALGLARGTRVGGLAGFWAGLLLDLVPPAAGPVGGWMLVLGVVGALAGRVGAAVRPGPFSAMALVGAGAAAAVLARSAVLWFAGVGIGPAALGVAAASAGYALLVAPVALMLVWRRPQRRTAPVRTVPREVSAP